LPDLFAFGAEQNSKLNLLPFRLGVRLEGEHSVSAPWARSLRLHDEPCNGVQIDPGNVAPKAEGLNHGGPATHEWVEDVLAVRVRIACVVLVELVHDDFRAGLRRIPILVYGQRLERPE
jgi:hypothetical protein